jgi:transcriptional regulator with XRE-family HTH domain
VTSDQLRAWRGRLGLSQAAAAAALGLSRRAYQHYESGTRAIPEPAPGIAALTAAVESKAASEGRE